MPILDQIRGPEDVKQLSPRQVEVLTDEVREFLIRSVSRTGGHLGPNLGVVEMTIALHRVFTSPDEPIIFDTGHQSYVHKLLTGRAAAFDSLRQKGGLSGYPSRAESVHDWVESSHASAALSWAEGLAKGFQLAGERRCVVAVVGDGALTGGLAWEALNNISQHDDLPLVIVVNDNGRSYTPTVGGMVKELTDVRTDKRYEQVLELVRKGVSSTPLVGRVAYEVLHGVKMGLKDILAPQTLFSDLGLKYIGPVDGHDEPALEQALDQARRFGGPVIVHCVTQKGKGFAAAEAHEADQFHAVGRIDPTTGEPLATSERPTWTDVFGQELVRLADDNEELVAITAAMMHPVGLHHMARVYPGRVFDVGIAEQHAVTSAAGLAAAGRHPVVAVYATFMNRAFDQVLMDVALHGLGVTFVLDRAGVTGPDGASHHGVWDLAAFGLVPGLQVACPRDAARLRAVLGRAVEVDDAPTMIRFSKDALPADREPVHVQEGLEWLAHHDRPDAVIVAHGSLAHVAVTVAERLQDQGMSVDVIDPVWALPINPALVAECRRHRLVFTVEDGMVVGGAGDRLSHALRDAGAETRVHAFGVPPRFLGQGSRDEVLAECGLDVQSLTRSMVELLAGLETPDTAPSAHVDS